MQSFYFYHQHLEKVSRSFSFCISQLTSPAKEWVALSYLLLRVVDTIEDLKWSDVQAQHDAFELLKLFLKNTPSEQQVADWLKYFPEQIPLDEKNLILDLVLLLNDKNQLPDKIKHELTNTIIQMVDGMEYFLRHYKFKNTVTFPSLITTNQYCFFVAGLVGKLLSRIFTYLTPDFKWSNELLNQSFHFGLFLQKINILKDHVNDEEEGRHYIASREDLRESLVFNSQHALDYIKSIPVLDGRSYRLFCAWSFFIGLASLKWLDKNWQMQQQKYKIKSKETYYLVNQISQIIDDNQALEQLFKHYFPVQRINASFYGHAQQMPSWFQNIYFDEQASIDWFALGMIECE